MTAALTCIVAVAFALMGVLAIVKPGRILMPFGIGTLPVDARNEVRAVYGGFGIAVAMLLVATLAFEPIRMGARIAVAAALTGMAAGRILSAIMDRRLGRYPLAFLVIELAMAAMLLAAAS